MSKTHRAGPDAPDVPDGPAAGELAELPEGPKRGRPREADRLRAVPDPLSDIEAEVARAHTARIVAPADDADVEAVEEEYRFMTRLPGRFKERLKTAAKEKHVSVNGLITELLETGLQRHDEELVSDPFAEYVEVLMRFEPEEGDWGHSDDGPTVHDNLHIVLSRLRSLARGMGLVSFEPLMRSGRWAEKSTTAPAAPISPTTPPGGGIIPGGVGGLGGPYTTRITPSTTTSPGITFTGDPDTGMYISRSAATTDTFGGTMTTTVAGDPDVLGPPGRLTVGGADFNYVVNDRGEAEITATPAERAASVTFEDIDMHALSMAADDEWEVPSDDIPEG